MKISGFDVASPLNSIRALRLRNAGNEFVVRYLSKSEWKRLTLREINDIKEAGLHLISVYQDGAKDFLSGYAAGVKQGTNALLQAQSLSQPKGSVIFFAIDFDITIHQIAIANEFLSGVCKALAGQYKVGVYGSYTAIEGLANMNAADFYWQTYAWSKGKESPKAHLYQYKNDTMVENVNVDLNYAYTTEIYWDYSKPVYVDTDSPVDSQLIHSLKQDIKDLQNTVYKLKQTVSQHTITNNGLIKSMETLEKENQEIPMPKWFEEEFGDRSKTLNRVTGNMTFWRSFAVSLRILKNN